MRDPNPRVRRPRAARSCAAPGCAVTVGVLEARGARSSTSRFVVARGGPRPVRAAEGGPHPRRAHRHRGGRVEVDHERRAAARGPRACGGCTTRWRWASAPSSPTIPCCCRTPRGAPPVLPRSCSTPAAAARSTAAWSRSAPAARRCWVLTRGGAGRSARRARAPRRGRHPACRPRRAASPCGCALRELWRARPAEPDGRGRRGAAGRVPRRARLFDQVALFRAPLLLGGRAEPRAFGGPDPARLADAPPRLAARRGRRAGRGRRLVRGLVPRALPARRCSPGIVEEIGTVRARWTPRGRRAACGSRRARARRRWPRAARSP